MSETVWAFVLLSQQCGVDGQRGPTVEFRDEDGDRMLITFPTMKKAREFQGVIDAISEVRGPWNASVQVSVLAHDGEVVGGE